MEINEDKYRGKNIYKYIEEISRYNMAIYIGNIDIRYFKEIEKYLKFYIIAYFKVYKTGKVNLKQTAAMIYDFPKDTIEEINLNEAYKNPKILDGDDEFIKFYEKLTTDFSNATINKKLMKSAKIKISKLKNYEGKKIKVSNIKEMKALNGMWRAKLDNIENAKEAEKAYKKIRGNKVDKMTDKNYNELYKYLNNSIKNMDEEFKNIYYYKLEIRYNNELRKVILKNINKLSNDEEKKLYIRYSVKYLFFNPVLNIRESLAEKLYNAISTTSNYSIREFECELINIIELVNESKEKIFREITGELLDLECVNNKINVYERNKEDDKKLSESMIEDLNNIGKNITYLGFFTPDDVKEFKEIYNEDGTRREFQNNYKIKKDYTSDDVKLYSETIHDINKLQMEKIIDSLKKVTLK